MKGRTGRFRDENGIVHEDQFDDLRGERLDPPGSYYTSYTTCHRHFRNWKTPGSDLMAETDEEVNCLRCLAGWDKSKWDDPI